MSVRSSAFFCLLLCVPAFVSPQSPLRMLAEAALAHDPNRLKSVETLRAAEADASAERSRRLLDGSLSAAAGKQTGIGPSDSGGTSLRGSLSASTCLPAGATLSVGSTYAYAETDASTGNTGSLGPDSASFSAGVKIPVFVNGFPVDVRLSDAARALAVDIPLETARETASEQDRSTADTAIRLALDAASADRACALAARQAEIAARDAEIARVKRTLGTISYADLSKLEKDADSARLAALESRFTREKKLRALCAATGMAESSIDPGSILVPDIALDARALEGSAVTKDMRQTSRDRRSAEMSRVLAGAEYAPTFDLSASSTVPGPATRGRKTGDTDNQGTWTATAAVTVPIPPGATAKVRAADARLAAARLGEEAVSRTAADDLGYLRNAWTMARAKVELRSQLLDQARARLRDAESAFGTGTATKLDVDRALLAADDAAAALEDDRAAGFRAALDLYNYFGFDPLSLLKDVQP